MEMLMVSSDIGEVRVRACIGDGLSPRQDYEILFTVTMRRSVFVSSGQVNFLQNISVGHHVLQSDEPSDTGGKDAAPDPHELLLASLGACTSITAQMYAARKRWPLEEYT